MRVSGCFDPMPLAPRATRPPAIPPRVDLAKQDGYFYVADVYVGTGMETHRARHGVKSLRVVESPEKRFWTRTAWNGQRPRKPPAWPMNDFNNKRILGTVPVEEGRQRLFFRAVRYLRVFPTARRPKRMMGPVDAERHDRPAR